MRYIIYASVVRSLIYAMIGSRPDLPHTVGVVSRFMSKLWIDYWMKFKWILRYMRSESKTNLRSVKIWECVIEGFSLPDNITYLDIRRSISGYVFNVRGNTVLWKYNLQSLVALSTTKAEYMALLSATKEAIWLNGICEELGFQTGSAKLHCNSKSALAITKNKVFMRGLNRLLQSFLSFATLWIMWYFSAQDSHKQKSSRLPSESITWSEVSTMLWTGEHFLKARTALCNNCCCVDYLAKGKVSGVRQYQLQKVLV